MIYSTRSLKNSYLSADASTKCQVKVCSTKIQFEGEYGHLNIIDEKTFNNLRKPPNFLNLFEFLIKPYGNKNPIETIGGFTAKCSYDGTRSIEKFVVVKGSNGNLLSYQASANLGVPFLLDELKISATRPKRKNSKSYELNQLPKDEGYSSKSVNLHIRDEENKKTKKKKAPKANKLDLVEDLSKKLPFIDKQLKLLNKALKEIETEILKSTEPIYTDETKEIDAWNAELPLSAYRIHKFSSPQIIKKQMTHEVEYVQQLAIRYLKPSRPENRGEIIITKEPDIVPELAPPIILRQAIPIAITPEPVIYREHPPSHPNLLPSKIIKIVGKKCPPPPRKVILEQLSPMPKLPKNVIIERWLPYKHPKRVVICKKPSKPSPVVVPQNLIIQWEAPRTRIVTKIVSLGVIKADPEKYLLKYSKKI